MPDQWALNDMDYYARKGIEPEVIDLAINASLDAPRPSWRYAVAVLARCVREGCYTVEDFRNRSAAHLQKRIEGEAPRRQPTVEAQRYTQRQYTREELEKLFEPI